MEIKIVATNTPVGMTIKELVKQKYIGMRRFNGAKYMCIKTHGAANFNYALVCCEIREVAVWSSYGTVEEMAQSIMKSDDCSLHVFKDRRKLYEWMAKTD